ncbi:hypothetical protein NIES23_61330 (plasmid) [Trichormus variabilis NIES-23]|uniref:Uncharacterized protein n=1 Tax=Trichormus variabilis NIES-23 TaxID=1973479 RepID=A0A1Z4KWB5_ANAVA|nr:hypothetical protein NIES23_61330 [Trichormus variabilis NIES-23]
MLLQQDKNLATKILLTDNDAETLLRKLPLSTQATLKEVKHGFALHKPKYKVFTCQSKDEASNLLLGLA